MFVAITENGEKFVAKNANKTGRYFFL